MIPTSDYTQFDNAFASEYVLACLGKKIQESEGIHALRFITANQTGAYVGQLFEILAHLRIKKGGTFFTRILGKVESLNQSLSNQERLELGTIAVKVPFFKLS